VVSEGWGGDLNESVKVELDGTEIIDRDGKGWMDG